MDEYSKPKKVNISKEVLEKEKKKHKCNNTDVLKLLGYSTENRSLFNKYNYCFDVDRVKNLCKAWDIRIEYLCGIDEYRDLSDFYNEGFLYAEKLHTFFDLLGYEIHSIFAVDIPIKYLKDIEKNRIFLKNSDKDRVLYHIKNDDEFQELARKGFIPMTYYYIYKGKKFLGILNMSELNRLFDTITSNCTNTIDSCIQIANNYYTHSIVENIKKDIKKNAD